MVHRYNRISLLLNLIIMNITINNQDAFVSYQNEIGISLYPNENCIQFFNENGDHKSVKHNETTSIKKEFLMDELLDNTQLRELAHHHNLISVCSFDRVSYLNYVLNHS